MIEHHPKPGWSPEHMSALMYTCHLGVYRRVARRRSRRVSVALRRLPGLRLRAPADGADGPDRPHSRGSSTTGVRTPMSTAGGDAKPYAYLAQPGAIADHLRAQRRRRRGPVRAPARDSPDRASGPTSTSVDLVLALSDADGLGRGRRLVAGPASPSLERRARRARRQRSTPRSPSSTSAGVAGSRITTVPTSPDGDPAAALAAAADAATAEHLLLMQAPAVGLTHDWLTRLIGYSAQAAASPPPAPSSWPPTDASSTPASRSRKASRCTSSMDPRPDAAPAAVYNLSAVSGVLATRRDTYRGARRPGPRVRELALIDYCLRATDSRPARRDRPRRPPARHRA